MATQNQVGVGLSGSSGSGSFAGTTSPTFVTPVLGTPSSGALSSCTGYAQSALTGLGTGISTALGINVGTAGSPVVNGGALGTPSSGTLTSCTGLPISGTTGYGTGVATALAANVTGSGAIVLANGPTFVTSTVTAPSITFNTTSGVIGTMTNDSAAAGSVGEIIQSYNSPPVSLTNGSAINITTISLTAGDWDVYYQLQYLPANTTLTGLVYAGIGATTGTITTNQFGFSSWYGPAFTGDGSSILCLTGTKFFQVGTTTTIYACLLGSFATSTAAGTGGLWARRRR